MSAAGTSELAFTPALELAARIRARELSPVELTELYLERIERLDPRLNAFVHLDADGALAAAHDPHDGPFAGVPIPIKDLTDVAGLPTTYSTKAYARKPIGAACVPHVRAMRDALGRSGKRPAKAKPPNA